MKKVTQSRISEKDLINKSIYFNSIKISSKKSFHEKLKRDELGLEIHPQNAGISLQWKATAVKNDNRGIVVGCDIVIEDLMYKCNLEIEVVMEFLKSFKEELIFKTCFFQVFAARLFFPYLVSIVVSNTARMDPNVSPLLLDRGLLKTIIEETEKQGPFKKTP